MAGSVKHTVYVVEGEKYKRPKNVKTLAKAEKLVASALRGKNKSVMITKKVWKMTGKKGHKKRTFLRGV